MTVGTRSITIDPIILAEGDSGLTPFDIVVRRTGDLTVADSFSIRTVNGTANALDYVGGFGRFTFEEGVSEFIINGLSIYGDTDIEGLEAFSLQLAVLDGPNSDTLMVQDGVVVILEDDANLAPVLRDLDVATDFETAITIDLRTSGFDPNGDTISVASVGFASGGTVVNNGNGTVTFTPNTQFAGTGGFTFEVEDEFGASSFASVSVDIAQPGAREITIGDARVVEGDSGTQDVVLTLTRTGDLRVEDRIELRETGTGTATYGEDYTISGQFVTFEAGQRTIQVTLTGVIEGDGHVEEDETFGLTAEPQPEFYQTIDFPTFVAGTVTIQNDDTMLNVSNINVAEGAGGEKTIITFTATRDGDLFNQSALYSVSLEGGTATAGVDFEEAQFLPFRFDAGQDEATFSVAITGDDLPEPDETLFLNFYDDDGLVAQGQAVIENDDVTFEIEGVTVAEGGDAENTTVSFTVTRTDQGVAPTDFYSVQIRGGTATVNEDFFETQILPIRFDGGFVGETKTISFTIKGDSIFEPDETVVLELRDDSGVVASGISVIANDDAEPNTPPDAKDDRFVTDLGQPVTITIADLLANDTDANGDALQFREIFFDDPAGELIENPDGSFTYTPLSEFTGEGLSGVYGISDGISETQFAGFVVDVLPPATRTIDVDFLSKAEGDTGTTLFTFGLTRFATGGDLFETSSLENSLLVTDTLRVRSFDAAYNPDMLADATLGVDYVALDTEVVFAAGETFKTVSVVVNGDSDVEPDEIFQLYFDHSGDFDNFNLPDDAIAVIENDDIANQLPEPDFDGFVTDFGVPITFTTADLLANDSDPDGGTLVVTEVVFETANGAVTDHGDGSFTFTPAPEAAGNEMATGYYVVSDQQGGEAKMGFLIDVRFPATRTVDATILSISEGDDGVRLFEFGLTRVAVEEEGASDPASSLNTTDMLHIVSGAAEFNPDGLADATAGVDYEAIDETVVFAPGETFKTVTVKVFGDIQDEDDEIFQLFFDHSGTYDNFFVPEDVTGTIIDDDLPNDPPLTLADTLTTDMGVPITFGPADLLANDTDPEGKKLGMTEIVFDQVNGDIVENEDGTFTFTPADDWVGRGVEAIYGASDGVNEPVYEILTIDIRGPAPRSIDASILSIAEGNAGTTAFTFALTRFAIASDDPNLSAPENSLNVVDTVRVRTGDATLNPDGLAAATAGVDYIALDTEVVFGIGETTKTVVVEVLGDGTVEPDEIFQLFFDHSGDFNNFIVPEDATGTIVNDDVPNDAPEPEDDTFTTDLGVPVTFSVADLLANDSDPENDTLTVTEVGIIAANAPLVDHGDGTFTYTPVAGFAGGGVTGFYKVSDGVNDPVTAEFNIFVNGPQDRTIDADILAISEGSGGVTLFQFELTRFAVGGDGAGLSSAQNSLNVTDTLRVFTGDATANPDALALATAGLDYTPVDTTVIFAPGETVKTVTVEVLADDAFEMDEIFQIYFEHSGDFDNFIVPVETTGTILNDDPEPLNEVMGTQGRDNLIGTDGDDALISGGGRYDRMTGGIGADSFVFGTETFNGMRERDQITDYEVGIDQIVLVDGAEIARITDINAGVSIQFAGDGDVLYVLGDGVRSEVLSILTDPDQF